MKRLGVAVLLAVLSVPALAWSQDNSAADSNWSLGAGLTFGTDISTLMAIDQHKIAPTSPPVSVMLERRLAPTTWLTFRAIGSRLSAKGTEDNASETAVSSLGAAVGMRFVLTTGKLMELSVNAGLGYLHESQTTTEHFTGASRETVEGVSHYQATAGLAVQRMLIENLALRLSANILKIGYLSTTTTVEGKEQKDQGQTGLELGLDFLPTIEVRFFF